MEGNDRDSGAQRSTGGASLAQGFSQITRIYTEVSLRETKYKGPTQGRRGRGGIHRLNRKDVRTRRKPRPQPGRFERPDYNGGGYI